MRSLFLGMIAAPLAFSQSSEVQPSALTVKGHVITGTGTDVRPVRRAKMTLTGGGLMAPLVTDLEFITAPAVGFGPPPSLVNTDWSFEVLAMSGVRAFGATLPPPWALKRIRRNGQDLTDTPLDFRKGDVEDLEVTFSSRVTTVSGTVTDDKNLPVPRFRRCRRMSISPLPCRGSTASNRKTPGSSSD